MTASQIIHRIHGSRPHPDCVDVSAFRCWVCGGESMRGVLRHRWMGANYTGQNKARCPSSEHVCEACVTVMAGRPPDTERMWSHLVEGDEHVRVNKGQKPAIRAFLRRPHRAPWFAAIADSGQKHLIPWTPINAPNQPGGRVMFEEVIVELPRTDDGWRVLDDITDALTDGATKEEILRGDYSPRAWQLLGADRLRALEATWSRLRGGAWFDLAVWLAQRDEEKVKERMAAEKAAKEKKDAGRKGQGAAADAARRGRARAAERVPADAGVLSAQALDADPRADACVRAADGDARGVGVQDDADASARGPTGEQLALFP